MNTINFKCSECHQPLEVDAGHAGTAVACPECGQTILVPPLARIAQPPAFPETPARSKSGWLVGLAIGAILFLSLVAALLLWPKHGRNGPAVVSDLPDNLTSNLVLYFSFAKPPAGNIPDLSGHGNDGDAANVQWIADGPRGGALSFSPSDSHIRVANNDSLNPAQFTLSAWIKTSRVDRYWRRIFDKGIFHNQFDLSVAGDWTKWHPASKYRGYIEFEMPKTKETASQRPLADGQWHQIVATYDGQDKRLFVDGQLQSKAHRPNLSLGNSLDLVIGGFTDPDPVNDDPHASFDGSLAEVMMFSRALTPEEIQSLYGSQRTAPGQ